LTIRNGSAGVALFGVDGRVAQLSNVVVRDTWESASSLKQCPDHRQLDREQRGHRHLLRGDGRLTLSRSTINGNRGGGLTLFGPAELTNVTVSGNSSASYGGGIFADESSGTKLTNCTITGNSALLGGGGLAHTGFFPNSPFPAEIVNSVISGNTPEDCIGIPVIHLEPPTSRATAAARDSRSLRDTRTFCRSPTTEDPLPTHALGRDSDAVNAGDNAICASPAVGGVDQRGVARPQGAACDLGAYELILNGRRTVRPPPRASPRSGLPTMDSCRSTSRPHRPGRRSARDPDHRHFPGRAAVADGGYTPDGGGVGTATALVRAERDGSGDGRVYHIRFTAADGQGGRCSGEVRTAFPTIRGGQAPLSTGVYGSTRPFR